MWLYCIVKMFTTVVSLSGPGSLSVCACVFSCCCVCDGPCRVALSLFTVRKNSCSYAEANEDPNKPNQTHANAARQHIFKGGD